MIDLSLKVNGSGLFCSEDLGNFLGDGGVSKRKAKKYSAGDVLSFKIRDGVYGFARLIKQIELGYVSEIFAETSTSPKEGLEKLKRLNSFRSFSIHFLCWRWARVSGKWLGIWRWVKMTGLKA
ncbi:hypothetical protein ACX0KM_22420 [Pseudomonas promysalinigenes]